MLFVLSIAGDSHAIEDYVWFMSFNLSINRDGVIVKTAKKSDAVADEYAAAFVGKKIEILPGQIDYFLWHFTERFLV